MRHTIIYIHRKTHKRAKRNKADKRVKSTHVNMPISIKQLETRRDTHVEALKRLVEELNVLYPERRRNSDINIWHVIDNLQDLTETQLSTFATYARDYQKALEITRQATEREIKRRKNQDEIDKMIREKFIKSKTFNAERQRKQLAVDIKLKRLQAPQTIATQTEPEKTPTEVRITQAQTTSTEVQIKQEMDI